MYNPSLNGVTLPVALTTTNSTYWPLDTTYTGYTFNVTGQGVITLNSLTVSNYEVDTATTLTFSLSSHVQYLAGGYLTVVYNTNYTPVATTLVCSKSTGFKSSDTPTCSSNGTYSVIMYCTLDYTSTTKVFSFSFVNPLALGTVPSF